MTVRVMMTIVSSSSVFPHFQEVFLTLLLNLLPSDLDQCLAFTCNSWCILSAVEC